MPSRRSSTLLSMLLAALLISAAPSSTAAQPTPTTDQIETALQQVQEDPNLGRELKTRTLKWTSADKPRPSADIPPWLLWLQELLRWIASSARLVLWIVAALLAALVVIYVLRLLRSRMTSSGGDAFIAPSHVRDLDIRPESLPADIGSAAFKLWQEGEHRRALALLYRGLLSRMVHAHRAPVRDSTTEGECVALAQRHLPAAAGEFAALLVTTWQRAVYGGLAPATPQVQALCAGFAPALDAPVTDDKGTAQ